MIFNVQRCIFMLLLLSKILPSIAELCFLFAMGENVDDFSEDNLVYRLCITENNFGDLAFTPLMLTKHSININC